MGLVPIPSYEGDPQTRAVNIVGVDLEGRPRSLKVCDGHGTVLVFIGAHCYGCIEICRELVRWMEIPTLSTLSITVITKSPIIENPESIRAIVPTGVEVLMSSDAWRDYRVAGPPFYVFIDGDTRRVLAEGVVLDIDQIARDISRSLFKLAKKGSSLFLRVGGEAFFLDLVRYFYEGVDKDELLRPMYPDDLEDSKLYLGLFLMQYWGGPDTYNQMRTHPRLRMRHAPFKIGKDERDRWMIHMINALDKVTTLRESEGVFLATQDLEELRDYFEMAATSMVNSHDR